MRTLLLGLIGSWLLGASTFLPVQASGGSLGLGCHAATLPAKGDRVGILAGHLEGPLNSEEPLSFGAFAMCRLQTVVQQCVAVEAVAVGAGLDVVEAGEEGVQMRLRGESLSLASCIKSAVHGGLLGGVDVDCVNHAESINPSGSVVNRESTGLGQIFEGKAKHSELLGISC